MLWVGLTLLGQAAAVSAQTQISPSGLVTNRTPTFTWTASPLAQWYSLWVDDSQEDGKVNVSTITPAAAGCSSGTGSCHFNPGVVLAPGAAYWQLGVKTSVAHAWSADMAFTVPKAIDTTVPIVTITGPTSSTAYTTATSVLTLSGTATDNTGVTQVTWANNRGGSGMAAGTSSWSANVTLQGGMNVLTITARDAADNLATDTVTVTYTSSDTTKPAVAITGPTSGSTYVSVAATLTLSGTASDNVGVAEVTWTSDRGGSGKASGTTLWSAALTLASGTTVVTVTARDAANNVATDTLSVTYAPPTKCPSPVGATTTQTPSFCWNPTSGAQYYSLWVDDSHVEGKIDLETILPAAAGCANETTVCSVSPGVQLAPGPAYWQVGVKTSVHGWGAPIAFSVPDPNAPCLSLSPISERHPADPQTGFIVVTTNGCAWTATTAAPWVVLTPGWTSGVGNGQVRYDLMANTTGASREADIVIGPVSHHVTQYGETSCGGVLSGYGDIYDANAHVETVSLSIGATCAWTAVSNVSWVTLRAESRGGTGPATIRWDVAPNSSTSGRSGTLNIAGRIYAVEQHGATTGDSCPTTVTPLTTTVSRAAASYQIGVSAPAGCTWSAASLSSFIDITGGAGGSGSGTVTYLVHDNPSAEARTGDLDIASHRVEITQIGNDGSGCTFSVSGTDPLSAGLTNGSISISAPAACFWTATSESDFLTITDGASGSGPGTIRFAAANNAEHESRLGAFTIAGQTVGIMQLGAGGEPTCVTAVAPSSISTAAIGTSGTVAITAAQNCAWAAVSGVDWVTLGGPSAPRFGSGTFSYQIGPNAGLARAVTFEIGSQELTINQDGAIPTGNDGIEILWPGPESKKANDCNGNCGKGCGTFLAVCGTNGGNWTSEVLGDVQQLDDVLLDVCSAGKLQVGVFHRYSGIVRWTYHGVESPSCMAHDWLCRSWVGTRPLLGSLFCGVTILGPYSYTICESARPWTWSYEEPAVGRSMFAVAIVDNPDAPSCER